MKLFLLNLFSILYLTALSQPDNCWQVRVSDHNFLIPSQDEKRTFTINDFNLLRNCIYIFDLTNDRRYTARIVDIKKDSIIITTSVNEDLAFHEGVVYDTICVHFRELKKLHVVYDRSLSAYQRIKLKNYIFLFYQDEKPCVEIKRSMDTNKIDSNVTEHLFIATAQGYERLEYFVSSYKKKKISEELINAPYKKRNYFWFTPSVTEEINGVALGVWTTNVRNESNHPLEDSLLINGLNIDIMPFGFIWLVTGNIFNNPLPNIEFYNRNYAAHRDVEINGLNIGLSGLVEPAKINGMSISGISTSCLTVNGIAISGFNHFSYITNGLSISGFQNVSAKSRGLQISLFNTSRDHRGIQIGLWNKNAKRSLPVINWQFTK